MVDKFFLGLNPNGFHKIVYSEWGDPLNSNVILCVHGLTRNRHDFDWLAEDLSKDYRVVCPDLAGRGDSDSLEDESFYSYPQYLSDLTALIARLAVKKVIWVGTSLGGILGMLMASYPSTPIKKLILNDIGSIVSGVGLKRISQYTLNPGVFHSIEAASSYFKKNHLQGIGEVHPDIWTKILKNSVKWVEKDNVWKPTYDPAVAKSLYRDQAIDADFTACWQEVICPVLILRGQLSDMLTETTAHTMAATGKSKVTLIELPKTGHPPSLTTPEQIKMIHHWIKDS